MRLHTVPDDVAVVLSAGGGLATSTALVDSGISHDRLRTLQRARILTPLAKGVYGDRRSVDSLPGWDRFRMATKAFLLASPPGCIAADWSAVAALGLPTPAEPPTGPSVIRRISRPASGSNRTLHGRTRFIPIPDRWVWQANGVPAVHPAVAAIDLARTLGHPWSLILTDAAAARCGTAVLRAAFASMERWWAIDRAKWAVDNADPDSESPLESAGRVAFLGSRLDAPASNVWLGLDRPTVRVDHLWLRGLVAAEADGADKYFLDGDPIAELRAEKNRELLLSRWGVRVVRYTWADAVGNAERLGRLVRTTLDAAPLPRHPRLRTWTAAEGAHLLGLPRNGEKTGALVGDHLLDDFYR